MKLSYFNQDSADEDDFLLEQHKQRGDVPETCLPGGETVFAAVKYGLCPCDGCNGPREKCFGKPMASSFAEILARLFGGE